VNKMSIKHNRKALALVTVLWVVVLLMVIVAAVGRNGRLDNKVCIARREGFLCKWACKAGIEKVSAMLNDDINASDSLNDFWALGGEDLNDVQLQGCRFTAAVVDESSKLNINTATMTQLLELPYMTEEIAAAILDWRDEDDEPSEGGVEGAYYENLSFGYMIRNGALRTIRELLMVKGVTEELLYGEDTNLNGQLDYNERDGDTSPPADNGDNTLDKGWFAYLSCYSYDINKDAEGNNRVNINSENEERLSRQLDISRSNAKWIVENRPERGYQSIADLINDRSERESSSSESNSNDAEPLDLETFSNIADKITVNDNRRILGRINVNTASRDVLSVLLGGTDEAEKLADNIISYRMGLEEGMESIADVMNADSITVQTFKKIANDITVRSNVYNVRCLATADRNRADGTKLVTEAVVDRSSVPCRILYWYQGVKN
jgi:DNA uptake protein ComE-like DNA-binding protein